MPSGFLHRRCAALAASRANIAVARSEAFELGSQCPDPLFMLGVFPLRVNSKPKPYGKMLHTRRTGRFLSTLCALAARRSDAEKAFVMGYLTHYALDSTVHPYVYAHSLDAEGRYSSAMHMRLENNWDTLYYHREGQRGAPASMPCVMEARGDWERIAALLSDAIGIVYPENPLPPDEIVRAFLGTQTLNRITRSRAAYCAAYVLERLLQKQYLLTAQFTPRTPIKGDTENAERAPWRSLAEPDRVRNEGLKELFEAAVDKAGALLAASSAFFDGKLSDEALACAIGNAGYDTGIDSLP